MPTSFTWRNITLVIFAITSLLSFFFVEPIPQDLAYHSFADTRKIWFIANFFDVISNLPYLLVGFAGMSYVFTNWNSADSWGWLILFLSIFLVAAGSSYYHLNPNNETLTWDRLPMAIGFMALFVIVLGEYVNIKLEHWLLIPMCLLGIFSVIYWHITDDLRIYAWVQFCSLGLLLVVISLYKPNTFQTKYLIYALVFYTLSKLTEYFDIAIFTFTQEMLSGHTIKHVLAAIGTFFFYMLLKYRNT